MGQSSSAAVGASKLTADNGNIIVDASDSCVSGIKLRSTGIIPISELIKQEKCSKNIQKLEQTYYNSNKKTTETVKPKEDLKSKKVKADFIETSFEDVPARRQWVRRDTEPKKPFESDAVKIGLKKPSKIILNEKGIVEDKKRDHRSKEPTTKVHYQKGIPDGNRNIKEANIREKNINAIGEHVDVRKDVRSSNRKEVRKNIGIGTQEYNKPKTKSPEKKTTIEQSKKTILKNNVIVQKFKESSVQTITKDKATSYENIKQLYKRNDFDEKKNTKNKCQDGNINKEGNKSKQYNQPQQSKQHKNRKEKVYRVRDFEEESTHQFQKHQISLPKRKSRKYGDNLKIETIVHCSIPPERYFQTDTNSNANQLERRAGRNYLNRKVAGEYYCKNENYCMPYNSKDVNSLNSCELLPPSLSLLPSASALEQAIKEHRKYVSAKEALESWKNLHTWKQHRKRFELSRNEYHQDNFDVATQTMSHCSENVVRTNKSNQYLQTRAVQNDIIVPSEKHLYKDFIVKMEHCLQKHSRLCELNAKRQGEGKFTWVQDKYRRWHKIMFDDFKN